MTWREDPLGAGYTLTVNLLRAIAVIGAIALVLVIAGVL